MKQRRRKSGAGGLVVFGLIVFLLADVVLVGWAVTANRGGASSTTLTAPALPTEAPPASTPSPAPTATVSPPTRIVAPLDGETAWRSEAGSCPGAPVSPEITTDAGVTWTSSDFAELANVSGVVAIDTVTEDIATVIGLDAASCAPVHAQSYVAGDDWVTYPERLTEDWYVDPADRSVVHSPAGDMPAPCDSGAMGVAFRSDTSSAILCGNGSVFRTTDAGTTWTSAATQGAAIAAIGSGADGYVLAATQPEGCAGVAVLDLPDASSTAGVLGCSSGAGPSPRNVAIGMGGATIWLWADDVVSRSSDGGVTWQ